MDIEFEVLRKDGKEIYKTESYRDIYEMPLYFSVKNRNGRFLGLEGLGGNNVFHERELLEIKKQIADRENLRMHNGFIVFQANSLGELLEKMLDVSTEIIDLWEEKAKHRRDLWKKVKKSLLRADYKYIDMKEAKEIERFFFPDGQIVFYPRIIFPNLEVCHIAGLFDAILSGLYKRYRSLSYDYYWDKALVKSLVMASIPYFYFKELKPCITIASDNGIYEKFIELLDRKLIDILTQPFSEKVFKELNTFIVYNLV